MDYRVSNPLRYPCFVPQSAMTQKAARTGIFSALRISPLHQNLLSLFQLKSFDGSSRVKLWISPPTFQPLRTLSPVIPNYARSFVLLAAAGNELADLLIGTVIFFDEELAKKAFFTHAVAASSFLIVQDPKFSCGVWAVSRPNG